MNPTITTYQEFQQGQEHFKASVRKKMREMAILAMSLRKNIQKDNCIDFPYYHHVFDDEKLDFERQLKYLKNYGEFISMDAACKLIGEGEKIDGRYFCLTFDDGFYNCYSGMMDITASLNIPCMIYLPTDWIGLNPDNQGDWEKMKTFYPNKIHPMAFLNWTQCKEMMNYQISFGSHTCSHANLAQIDAAAIRQELEQSKKIIEEKLETPCLHFACPWGQQGTNFDPQITTPIAKDLGYLSFATTHRGEMRAKDDLFMVKRDHILAEWGNYQLAYFLGK